MNSKVNKIQEEGGVNLLNGVLKKSFKILSSKVPETYKSFHSAYS
jgi:hypothetical protein